MAAQVPDTCPVCGYPLAALPPPRACPECSFRYDGQTSIWRAPSALRAHLHTLTLVGLLLELVLLPAIIFVALNVAALGIIPLLLVALAPLALCYAWLGYAMARSRRVGLPFAAVTPDGVWSRAVFRAYLLPWSDVTHARRVGPWVRVAGPARGCWISPAVLPDAAALAAFQEALAARVGGAARLRG